MIGGLAAVLFLCAWPVVAFRAKTLVWRDRVSVYERLGYLNIPFGENARYGLDAAVPIPGILVGLGGAVAGVLAAPEMLGLSLLWPRDVIVVLGPIATISFLGGMLLALSLLLFCSHGSSRHPTCETSGAGYQSGSTTWP